MPAQAAQVQTGGSFVAHEKLGQVHEKKFHLGWLDPAARILSKHSGKSHFINTPEADSRVSTSLPGQAPLKIVAFEGIQFKTLHPS